jgi:hypothetical protein
MYQIVWSDVIENGGSEGDRMMLESATKLDVRSDLLYAVLP